MMTMFRLLSLLALAALVSACGATHAAVPIERPALDVPPAPARLVEPVPLPPPPGPEPVADLPPAPPAGAGAKPKPSPPPTTTKPDPKVETPPADPPAPPPATQPAVPPLRTPDSPGAAEATLRIREITQRAEALLKAIDVNTLNRARREQYLNAQLLISQAEAAIKAANFEFARNLAEKAERLARELPGR